MLLPLAAQADTWEDYANARFRTRYVVGGAVIIAKDGEILHSLSYGFRNVRKTEPATLDTCFRIASATKLISAIGLLQLMEEKGLGLDTPAKDILGFHVGNPNFPDQPVTVRQILSHTSGLEQTQYYFPNWEKMPPGTKYFSKKYAPGTKYTYSNLNGGLIGAMIEALSGQSVNSYMQQHVFDPLGINAAYHPALLHDITDIADQLRNDGSLIQRASKTLEKFDEYEDTCDPRNHTHLTSGKLYISANGLFRIITMLQRGGELDGVRILQPETVEAMMQPQHLIPGSSVTGESPYGLCMHRVDDLPGGTWYGHQGRYEGLSSDFYFQPDTGLSIVVIGNGYKSRSINYVVTLARSFMEKAQEDLIPPTPAPASPLPSLDVLPTSEPASE